MSDPKERRATLMRELRGFDDAVIRAALVELLAYEVEVSLYVVVSECRRQARKLAVTIRDEISAAEATAADRLRRRMAAPRDEVADDDGKPSDPADFMRDHIVPPGMRRQ